MASKSRRWHFRQHKQEAREIAKKRIHFLFSLAQQTDDAQQAAEYAHLARKIASRVRMKVPADFQRSSCPQCHTPLRASTATYRIRSHPRHLVIHCNNCGEVIRRPLDASTFRK